MKVCSILLLAVAVCVYGQAIANNSPDSGYIFNREPLIVKPYTELPLGTIAPEGWLRDELERMAKGMTGNLDRWYPEVCGPRNAWLGGDGDTWERGPYWIDGLYPLARQLNDKQLIAKAMEWVEWTLNNQREDGYIGPRELRNEDRNRPAPQGAQIYEEDDWWPRMVMLKILQQHYLATNDQRVIEVMTRYFKYQLANLPSAPLEAGSDGKGGSWWARHRGGDNLMSVLWLYNVTGESWLLELAELINKQTLPWTDLFLDGHALATQVDKPFNPISNPDFHCVNLAMGFKTPVIRYQQDKDKRHIEAAHRAFRDVTAWQGQPHGLYGGDEVMHGPGLDRGSELCTAVEAMYSLEKMVEITGDIAFADRLERIAFNALPTQVMDDHTMRQYFQQANQVEISRGDRSFRDDGGLRLVYGLLHGYPCCTCNYHQGWPKFVQHMWLATVDGGLAAMLYGPSTVTAMVANGSEVTIKEQTNYPFEETIVFTIASATSVTFPLHLRVPGWCREAQVSINGNIQQTTSAGKVIVLDRTWNNGDVVELSLPMHLYRSTWYENSVAIERGPLVYALRLEEKWSEVVYPAPDEAGPESVHRGYREVHTDSPWNYALLRSSLNDLEANVKVIKSDKLAANPWNLANAPIELQMQAVKLPDWTIYRRSAGPVPRSPAVDPQDAQIETIRLIPYGCTTLRISGFPWVEHR
ncbi:MAG: glycoside hydrolase family 127 protein [Sedimentisphaerales bacterium]|nr:glycoside hydrolase family 127 protein [Sedimentisphaerales bacterium]